MDDGNAKRHGRGGRWIRTVVLTLGCAGIAVLAWILHKRPLTRIDGAHLLYWPVVLACLWFGWRGLLVAVLGAAGLVWPHFLSGVPLTSSSHDILRAVALITVAAVVAGLKQRYAGARRDVEQLRRQLEKRREASEAECEILRSQLSDQFRQLREQGEILRASDAEKARLLDSMDEEIVSLDREMRVQWANRAACGRFGLAREAVIGRPYHELRGLADVSCSPRPVWQAMRTGQTTEGAETAADGRRWSVHCYPIADSHGAIIGGVEVALDVTEAETAEDTLADERTLLRALIDHLPDAIYAKDRESRFLLCNQAVLRYHGVEEFAALEGKTDFAFFPKAAADEFFAEEQELMRTGCPIVGRQRQSRDRATGRTVWHSTTKLPLKDAQGEIVGLFGIGRDITDLKRVQEAYEILVDHSLQGLVVFQDQRVVFANQAMVRITGYLLEEILNASVETLHQFVHPDDRERVWSMHRARMAGQVLPDSYTFRAIRKNGALCWLEIHASRTEYQGRPAIQASLLDVTERICAENALRESETQNRALFDAIPDQIFLISNEGVFLDYRSGDTLGLYVPPDEFLGKTVAEILPPEVAALYMESLHEVLETGQTKTFEYPLPIDGILYDWECRLVCFGRRQVLAMVRDITERKRTDRLRDLQRDVALELSSISGFKDGYLGCLQTAVRFAQMDCGAIYTLDRDTGNFDLVAQLGFSEDYVSSVQQVSADSAVGRSARAGEPVFGRHGTLAVPVSPTQRREGLRAMAVVPVKRKGRVIAFMSVASRTVETIPEWSRVVLEMIAAQIGSTVGRLRAEEALQREHGLVSRITDTSPAGIMLINRKGRIVFANACAERIMGLSKDEITRRAFNAPEWRIADHDGRPMSNEELPFTLVATTNRPVQDVRYSIERPDGSRVLLSVNAAPLRDETGHVDGMVAAIDDVTERVQAEQSLRESEERFRHIFENTVLGLYRTSPEGQILMANPALVRMLGYASFDEMAQRNVVDGYVSRDAHTFFQQLIEDEGQVVGLEAIWRKKDGTPLFVCENAKAVRDESGCTLYYEGTVEDVTQRKEAERSLRQRLDFEELVSTISNDFVNLSVEQIDQGIERTLERIGCFAQVDRGLVSILDENSTRFETVHEWCAEGVASTRDRLLGVEIKCLPLGLGHVARDSAMDIPRVGDLPGADNPMRELLEASGVKSVLIAPIMIGGELFGMLSVDALWNERSWSEDEVSLVKMVAEVFANALERKRAADALSERLAFETLLSELSATFVNLPLHEIDAQIERWLGRVGMFLRIDRTTIGVASADGCGMVATHAWAAPGLDDARIAVRNCNHFQWLWEALAQDKVLAYHHLSDAPPEASDAADFCRQRGIKSIAIVPLVLADEGRGAMAFSSVCRVREWSDELMQRLRLVGETFAGALRRKQAEEALIASERNYREIFNAVNDATFVHDPTTGAIVDVNNATFDMFGYSHEDMLRTDPGILHHGDIDKAREQLRQWLSQATNEGPQVVEWYCRRKDGVCFYAEVNLKQASIGGQPRVLAVVRDITERKQAEKAAELHRAELTRAWHVNTLGEMASGLAHELNQPLCAVLNYANGCLRLTRRKELPKEALTESIQEIIGQAERAGDIMKRIRGLVGKREPRCVRLDVRTLLSDAMKMVEKEAAKHEIAVVPEFANRLPRIYADDVEIEQVALNLMRNAIEAMGDEVVTRRTLTVSTSRQGRNAIEVAIRDTGRGLPPELSEQVFNSFFTTKQRGLGIGLSLSRRIVEAHGGRLWAESDGRSGTTFRFTLPVVGASHGTHRARSLCR